MKRQMIYFMKAVLVLVICMWYVCPAAAQKIKNVCGEFTYYAEGNETPNDARQKALDGARLKAIADEFGTIISQSTLQEETSLNGDENSFFSQLSSSEVKGEWIEDTSEPEYEISYLQDMLVVKCRICGKAREISNEWTDFKAMVLRNGTEEKFAGVEFRQNDDMYLRFKSPVDGYVAVYLIDDARNAFCLLPYMSNSNGQYPVSHGKDYVFFSQKWAGKSETVDEFTMTCTKDIERNQIYVIFSPSPFVKASDTRVDEELPRQLTYEEFSAWLGKCRKRDPKMGVKVINIRIRK